MNHEERQFCTFFLDGHQFGIEVSYVQEVLRLEAMTRVPLTPGVIRGLLNLRGQIVTAIDLRRRLGLNTTSAPELPMNIIVRTHEGPVSLLVDEIGDVLSVSQEALERLPEPLQGIGRELIAGIYKLPHSLLLILNTEKTLDLSSTGSPPQLH